MQGRVAEAQISASAGLHSEEDGLLGAPMKPKEKSMEECCLDALKKQGSAAAGQPKATEKRSNAAAEQQDNRKARQRKGGAASTSVGLLPR